MRAVTQPRNTANIRKLLDLGADIAILNKENRSALHYAASVMNNADNIACLISAGAPLDVSDIEGKTPLEIARAGQSDAVLLLQNASKVGD